MNLDGKTAIVTGAAKRVGRAIATELARCGCNVVVHHLRSGDEAIELAEQIRRLSRGCETVQADLADPDAWQGIINVAVNAFGRIDVLINNASNFDEMRLPEFTVESWDRILRVNLTSVAGLCHHAAPHLQQANPGKIVNLTDISADRPWSSHLAYCVSKAGVVNLTRSLAKALAPNVQVNAVSPGIAQFPESYDDDLKKTLIDKVPLKRPGTPDDIANCVRYLCADGDYITGQIINVDGGRSVV